MFNNIKNWFKQLFNKSVKYTHIYKMFNTNTLYSTYLSEIKIDVKRGKVSKCINCGKQLNYDNDGISVCNCDDYSYVLIY